MTIDELREQLALSEAACLVQVKTARAENEQLKADIDRWHRHYASLLNEAHDENERLQAVVEAARGIALRDSPAHQRLRDALAALDRHKE